MNGDSYRLKQSKRRQRQPRAAELAGERLALRIDACQCFADPLLLLGDLVQRRQMARRELALEAAIAKLDKYHLLILDDLAYVTKDQAETSVLFELISARYERRSLLITANQPFGEWGKIFPEPTTS